MQNNIGNFLISDKKCLVDDPWEQQGKDMTDKRNNWVRCAGEKAQANFIMSIGVLMVILIIFSFMAGVAAGPGIGIGIFIFGSVLVVGGSYLGNYVFGKKNAEVIFHNYENELNAAKERGETEKEFINAKRAEKMHIQHINALSSRSGRQQPLFTL